jgi:hypothetical protein
MLLRHGSREQCGPDSGAAQLEGRAGHHGAGDHTRLGARAPPTTSPTATFTFSGNDNVDSAAQLGFQCSLDGGTFQMCLSPTNYTDLALGSHSFRVRAIDRAGNVDDSPASHLWTIEAPPQGCTAPAVTAAADRDAWISRERRRATSAETRFSRQLQVGQQRARPGSDHAPADSRRLPDHERHAPDVLLVL